MRRQAYQRSNRLSCVKPVRAGLTRPCEFWFTYHCQVMYHPLRLLIAESESAEARQRHRDSTGRSGGETSAATLVELEPECIGEITRPVEEGTEDWQADRLARFDGIFLSGSPLHALEDSLPVQRHLRFMQAVFASATPCFGSCAGLQIAAAAAGGKVRAKCERHEAGLARSIWATERGRKHPLLDGHPASWDALCIHSDEVEQLPERACLLASNASTHVQAAEIHFCPGIFWGVQYHPEMPLGGIAAALRRQSEGIISQNLARTVSEVDLISGLFDQLHEDPSRPDFLWRLGTNKQVADRKHRTLELRKFLNYLVKPNRS
jgi:GMP synthase (glutamine-hydrolysing)